MWEVSGLTCEGDGGTMRQLSTEWWKMAGGLIGCNTHCLVVILKVPVGASLLVVFIFG